MYVQTIPDRVLPHLIGDGPWVGGAANLNRETYKVHDVHLYAVDPEYLPWYRARTYSRIHHAGEVDQERMIIDPPVPTLYYEMVWITAPYAPDDASHIPLSNETLLSVYELCASIRDYL